MTTPSWNGAVSGLSTLERGRFSGGGAAEPYTEQILELEQLILEVKAASAATAVGQRQLSDKQRNPIKAAISRFARRLGDKKTKKEEKKKEEKESKKSKPLKIPTTALNLTKDSKMELSANNATKVSQMNLPSNKTQVKSKPESLFPRDVDIDFGRSDLTFARRAYRVGSIPSGPYVKLLSQTMDDGSIVLVGREDNEYLLILFLADKFPSDKTKAKKKGRF